MSAPTWRALCNRTRWGVYIVDQLGRIANVDLSTRENAHLAAAAPDMLKALKGVVRVADRATEEFDAARAAIDKAELTK